MRQDIKTCTILESPVPSAIAAAMPVVPNPIVPQQFAIVIAKKWPDESILTVRFLDGLPAVQEKVKHYAAEWSHHCNIRFEFVYDGDADIRISFGQPGSWSYVGTDARWIPKSQPTMNFGWLTEESPDAEYQRVVVHEFGHALGLIHEHQNPAGGIPWDKEAVYDYYSGPPNNWTRDQVDVNLFDTYDEEMINFSAFDRESIMLYPVPNEFTVGDFEVGWNTELSDTDKHWIGLAYPKSQHELIVDEPAQQGAIGEAGEIDRYVFTVSEQGRYVIEVLGTSDLVMSLFGPNDDATFVASDDDSGQRLNPRLALTLDPGTYTIRLQHFNRLRTGDYEIAVTRADR